MVGEMQCRNGNGGCVCVGGPVLGGGRGVRGIGGRVEPEGGRGGGRGAVECVGEAASRSVKHDTVWKINKFKVARM
jgi:hypothetical protein